MTDSTDRLLIAGALGVASLPDPTQYESFYPRKGSAAQSYLESRTSRKAIDKIGLAVLAAPQCTLQEMGGRFDWMYNTKLLRDRITDWNRC